MKAASLFPQSRINEHLVNRCENLTVAPTAIRPLIPGNARSFGRGPIVGIGTARVANGSPGPAVITFRLRSPGAQIVLLAADFTDWERLALHLRRGADGVWEIKVPLLPGRYGYRFLVDGQVAGRS